VSLSMGDVAAAETALLTSRPLWGDVPAAPWYHYAALTAAVRGDLPRAQQLLTEGIARHPRAAALQNNLAALLERRGAYNEALAAAEQGLGNDPAMPQLHKNVGDLYYRANRYDEAYESFERAVRADPDLGDDVYLKLGNIRLRRQEPDEAVRAWQRALELDPTNGAARTSLESVRQPR